MLKIIKFPVSILLAMAIISLAGVINLKMFFSSPDTAKSFLDKSGMYPLVAGGIGENLLKADVPEDQKQAFLEISNSVLDENTIKSFTEDIIDQFFTGLKNKESNPKLVIHLASLSDKVKGALAGKNKALVNDMPAVADKTVELNQNALYKTATNLDRSFLYLIISIGLFSLILLLGESWKAKLGWLSFSAAFAGLVLGVETLFYNFGLSENMIQLAIKKAGFEDQQFVAAIEKLVVLIVDRQKGFYLTATIVVFAIGIVLYIISKFLKKPINKPDVELRKSK